MSLHPVLAEKLSAALVPTAPQAQTRRDVRLPTVSGKVHAVIGMRRAGKTTGKPADPHESKITIARTER